jgi:hypothetical protein
MGYLPRKDFIMPQKIKQLLLELETELNKEEKLDTDEKEQLGNSISLIRSKLELENEDILQNMGDDLEKMAIKYEENLPNFSSIINRLTQSLTALGI